MSIITTQSTSQYTVSPVIAKMINTLYNHGFYLQYRNLQILEVWLNYEKEIDAAFYAQCHKLNIYSSTQCIRNQILKLIKLGIGVKNKKLIIGYVREKKLKPMRQKQVQNPIQTIRMRSVNKKYQAKCKAELTDVYIKKLLINSMAISSGIRFSAKDITSEMICLKRAELELAQKSIPVLHTKKIKEHGNKSNHEENSTKSH